MASSEQDQDAFLLFRYTPSLAAAVIFALIFIALSLLHSYQVMVTRTWFFIAFLFGCYCTISRHSRNEFESSANGGTNSRVHRLRCRAQRRTCLPIL